MTLYDISEFSPYEGVLIPLNVTLTLKGIMLKVQDRKIKEIQTGECQASRSIKCEDSVILEKELGSISLPGSIDLGENIPIKD